MTNVASTERQETRPDQPTVTRLEMNDLEQLRASDPIDWVSLKQTPPCSWMVRPLFDRIAEPYRWSRRWWSDADWRRRLANPNVRYATIHLRNNPGGLAEFERRPDHQVEITMFGLLPEYRGHGVEELAVTLVTKSAWHLTDARGQDLQRVWLQASDLDAKMLSAFMHSGFHLVPETG